MSAVAQSLRTIGATDSAGIARADLLRFLSACYYQPEAAFTQERMFEAMHAAACAVDPEIATAVQDLGTAFEADSLEDLLLDYTRLFLGPVRALASPYGSVWLDIDGKAMDRSTMAVLDLYDAAGFALAQDFKELPDHIAVELEVLYLLKFREHQANQQQDQTALSANARHQALLLNNHIGRWVPPFTASMAAGAQCQFYRQLAALTRHIIDTETAGVEEK